MTLPSGTRLGLYEIVAPIGAGGMGEVYKARDTRLNRIVALKLLPAAAANDTDRRERFEREAQAVAALNHPGIVTIHSVEQADGHFFLTMELVEGRSLADAMPSTGLSLDRLLKIAIAVADAMVAAHQKGITHRDLKPANIMLADGEHDGRVKVLDFGLAKLAEIPTAEAAATAMPTAPITGEGRILGTVAYMSPEQAEGKTIDARSDLFSLGVILYEMATGRRPFTGDTSISIISSIVKDTPKSVTELNPATPRDLGRIIRRALNKDLGRRYQTAIDLRNDQRMAFVHDTSVVSRLMIAEADGGNSRVLATRQLPAEFDSLALVTRPGVRPAWSPDGRVIAVSALLRSPVFQRQIVYVDSASGAEDVRPIQANSVAGLEWLDANTLLLDQNVENGASSQLWRLPYPSGALARLTNDLTDYIDLSMTAARDAVVTTKTERRVAIVVADGSGANAKEVVAPTTGSSGRSDAVEWAADRVLFTNTIGGQRTISSVGADGGSRQDLVTQGAAPSATSDGKTMVFNSTNPSRRGLWTVHEGGRPVQLVSESVSWHRVTRDGRSVIFVSSIGNLQSLWVVSIEGGTPAQIVKRLASWPILSPDGKAVAFRSSDEQGRNYVICNLPDCSSLRQVPPLADPGAIRIAWTPDNAGFLYATGTPQNLWVQSLDGKPARQLTHFTDDREIADAAWSRDGKRLAIARVTTTTDIVLIRGLKK